MNTVGALVLAVCTPVLSGIGLFALPLTVNEIVLEVIFLVSTAMALVVTLHMLLKGLAATAGLEERRFGCSFWRSGSLPPRIGMRRDSQDDHGHFTTETQNLQDSTKHS